MSKVRNSSQYNLSARRLTRALLDANTEIVVPAHLTQDEATYFTRLLSGRLGCDWTGPDLLRLERLAKMFALSDRCFNASDPMDPDDAQFERYMAIERLIVVMCRQLHLHQLPALAANELAKTSDHMKGDENDGQVG